ncbi:protein WVD2-like 7 isoform X3 [Rosa chinensis]|uniref:protein WVD2-like 7 isoform X3 n=1 Tax=Rosa chinensis TaxID=74649 RepID=UPI001AD8B32A|nr:protein WVD2-like 7 isoform X3 [Rosa chinensis]
MATYTEIGQHSQDISSSAILDHGSISFGRFAAETLAWEKWSVFRQNRCQEELEMYKSNGLVAQKRAYFEEYYKRVRALKALQSEHQETAQVDACPDVRMNSMQLENDNSSNDMSKQEKSAPDAVTNSDSSVGSTVGEAGQANKESLNDCNGYSDSFTVTDEAGNTLSNVDREQSSHQASVSATPPVTGSSVDREQSSHQASVSATPPVAGSSGVAKHGSLVSDPVKLTANEQKKLAPVLKAKGNAASVRNKSKLECTSTKDAVTASAKSKSLPLNQINGKRDNILLPSKSNTRMAASGKDSSLVSSHKKLTEIRSSAAVLHPSSTRIRMVPSSPCGRSDQRNANTNGKDLAESLRTSRPVHSRAVQNPSREKPITSGLKDKALEKWTCPGVSKKPSELSSQRMQPKVCQSENQIPNSMSTNIARNRLIRDTEADCGSKNYGKERNEKEGGEGINSTCRKDPKSSYNPASSIQKNLKLVHKGKEEVSTIRRRDSKPVSTVASIVEKNSKPFYKVVSLPQSTRSAFLIIACGNTAEPWSGGLKHTLKGTKV